MGLLAAAKTVDELSDPACRILENHRDGFTKVTVSFDVLNFLHKQEIMH
jgi:hypothetical protein